MIIFVGVVKFVVKEFLFDDSSRVHLRYLLSLGKIYGEEIRLSMTQLLLGLGAWRDVS